jgi:hypothetical protein
MVLKTQILLIWLNTWPVDPNTYQKPLKKFESNPITCCIMYQVLLPNWKMFYSCSRQGSLDVDNLNTTQTPECTKDKYNVKIIKCRVSPKVPPTIYIG